MPRPFSLLCTAILLFPATVDAGHRIVPRCVPVSCQPVVCAPIRCQPVVCSEAGERPLTYQEAVDLATRGLKLEEEMDRVLSTQAETQQALDAAQAELAQMREQLAAAQDKLAQESKQIARLKGQLAKAETVAQEAVATGEKTQKQLVQTRNMLKKARQTLKSEQKAREAADAARRAAEEKATQLGIALDAAQKKPAPPEPMPKLEPVAKTEETPVVKEEGDDGNTDPEMPPAPEMPEPLEEAPKALPAPDAE